MEKLNEKLKNLRTVKRLSQAELAIAAGISRAAYTFFENGTTDKLSLDAAKGIAKALGVSFNELFEVENPELESAKKEIERLKKSIDFNETILKLAGEQSKDNEYKSKLMDKLSRFVNLLFFIELANKQKLKEMFPADFASEKTKQTYGVETALRFFYKYGDEDSINKILIVLNESDILNESDYVFEKTFWNGVLHQFTPFKEYILDRIKEAKQNNSL